MHGCASKQLETGLERRATLGGVLLLRRDAESLAEILLVQAPNPAGLLQASVVPSRPSVTRASTGATARPTAAASFITKASFSVVEGKRATGGLRMCVVACPGAGSAILPPTRTTGSFDCAPASESLSPSLPARSGRIGSASMSAASFSSSSTCAAPVSVLVGCFSPSGQSVSAPATSPPSASSRP
jgi:hypothetical protein